jgi:hypothetical protein
VRAIGRRFTSAPVDFFIGPKALPAPEPEPVNSKGSK